ncbi:uncharacterized protein LOC144151924 isoform X2 [Haemaphysalis longicornis]
MFGIPHHKLLYRPRRCVEAAILDRKVQFLPEKHSVENKRGCLSTTIIPVIIIVSPRYLLAPISQLRETPWTPHASERRARVHTTRKRRRGIYFILSDRNDTLQSENFPFLFKATTVQPNLAASERGSNGVLSPSKQWGRLERLELGVPAACFGQRFCAWRAPCADVSDREHRRCLR